MAPTPHGAEEPRAAVRVVSLRVARALIIVAAIALVAARFAVIDAGSHSVSDTLRPWLVETALIAAVAVLAIAAVGRLVAPHKRRGERR